MLGLIHWVEGQLILALHPALRAAEASWLASITTPWLAEIDAADAGLAARCGQGWARDDGRMTSAPSGLNFSQFELYPI